MEKAFPAGSRERHSKPNEPRAGDEPNRGTWIGRGNLTNALSHLGPGYASENALCVNAAYSEAIACFDPRTRRFDAERAERYLEQLKGWKERLNPYHRLGSLAAMDPIREELTLAKRLSLMDAPEIVAALEIYHNNRRDYPPQLNDLVPRYLPKIPGDILTGEPPVYARIDRGHFQLASAHWHEGASAPEWMWHSFVIH